MNSRGNCSGGSESSGVGDDAADDEAAPTPIGTGTGTLDDMGDEAADEGLGAVEFDAGDVFSPPKICSKKKALHSREASEIS